MKPAEVYILNLEEPFKSIVMHLQLIIEQQFPEVELQFKWKIPFYVLDGSPFCYLNPSKKKGYVDVGFYGDHKFEKYNEFLISEGRKVVKSLRFSSIEEINSEILTYILYEANSNKEKGFWKK
ncbi:DUF1801 domain-containing protein [Tenacibaculum sp. 190524A05c]|uniref:2-dehydro-3-deoxyphosphooctonate aldolase n=1 Tax=Tenacibaculum platacis TaxID=3137852 RepID=A0ABP1EEX5_9FLAO